MSPSQCRLAMLFAVALGVLLRIPSLFDGFAMDDFAQLGMLGGVYPAQRMPLDLFTFSNGEPGEVQHLMDAGSLAWWSDPRLKLSALRPLSSALIWLDVALFGHRPFWHHLHSLLWWVAMMAVASRLLIRIVPPGIAVLALLFYALDECHTFPVAWPANRNALISATFGFLGLLGYVRWRRERWRPGPWLAAAGFSLALLGGEYGLGSLAYPLAWEAITTRERFTHRIRALGPILAVALIYVAVHRVLGYGAEGSGVYVDPLREPLAYAQAISVRVPILLGDMLVVIPTGKVAFYPELQAVQAVLGVLALGLVAGLLRATLRQLDRDAALAVAALMVGGLVALLPMVSSFVSGRLLVIPVFGVHVALAAIVVHGWTVIRTSRARGLRERIDRATRLSFGLAHLLVAPMWGMEEQGNISRLNRGGMAAVLGSQIDDSVAADQRMVVLTASDPGTLLYPPLMRWVAGRPLPRSWWVLSLAPQAHRLARISADTLELEVLGGNMLVGPTERLFRRSDRPFGPGDTVRLDGLTITIVTTAAGAPRVVRYRFEHTLESSQYRFLVTTPDGLKRYPIPPIGREMVIPPASLPLRLK